jgi:single-stranded-DNA-specific exonuclease
MLPAFQGPATLHQASAETRARLAFSEALTAMPEDRPVLLLGHNDADGLSALAILARALGKAGRKVRTRIIGRGESPWSAALREEAAEVAPAGVVVCDLGLRDQPLPAAGPTVVIDHHLPQGRGEGLVVITGADEPTPPTTSLLAWWSAGAVLDEAEHSRLLWLAALGLIGDMAEAAGFPEMAEARLRYGITALREATVLVNQPRRASSGDASPALQLLLRCDSPRDLLNGGHPELDHLKAAQAEVRAESQRVRRLAPRVVGDVALIRFASACQVHPLVAQQWRGRMGDKVVIAANTSFRPGWVHFAARTGGDRDLIAFLANHAPTGADEHYGSGHRQATGGALRYSDWNAFIGGLGFGPEAMVLS